MPKIVDKEAKRNVILFSAIKVFAEKGVANTKIADIAKAAGIGKGTVYEYYAGKEAIFKDAVNLFMKGISESIESSLLENDDPREKLRCIVNKSVEGFLANAEYLQVTLDFWAIGLRGEQIKQWKDTYLFFIQVISTVIEEGIESGIFRSVDSLALASGLIGMLDGILFQMIIFGDEFPLRHNIEAIMDHFLKGLAVE